MKHFIVFFLALTISPFLAQELNCKVSIIKEASLEVNSTELEIFKELELVLTELMNNTQWTKDQFKTGNESIVTYNFKSIKFQLQELTPEPYKFKQHVLYSIRITIPCCLTLGMKI